ncbi:hypothetical protein PhCBS80983_g02907 [Powellomyces hirtus]|uniref:F-box domain-containing protein n=1 Tax=Powellomyces hirtus TaxID=109895 RepID=A0A507E4N6_9FUNG|nr:hypothetical protein PhCBS80983_g02907 [Powellomyces hirtus]
MDLPEIAVKVFQYLEPVALSRCERACRAWHACLAANTNAVWVRAAAELSPEPGMLPARRTWETWKDVVRLKHCWGRTLPKMAAESRDQRGELDVRNAPTVVDGIRWNGAGEGGEDSEKVSADGRNRVTVMDSYSAGSFRDCIQTQQIGPNVVFTVMGVRDVRAIDIRASSEKTLSVALPVAACHREPPRLQRVFLSDMVPLHEGMGWMSFWDAQTLQQIARFRAITDDYCQGQLCGSSYACFNPRWSDDGDEEVDARRTVRMWKLEDPQCPRVAWNAQLPSHVVDVAQNGSVVACAFGSLLDLAESEDDEDSEDDEHHLFGLEFRSARTGNLIRPVPDLTGVQDIIFLTMTRFHCLVVRAPNNGQVVTIVDLATAEVVHEIDLKLSFTRTYGGLHVSDDETMLILWSSSNQLACLDLLRGTWSLHQRTVDDELFDKWAYGVWVAVEKDRRGAQESDSDVQRYTVVWKCIGGIDPAKRPHAVL